MGDNFCVEPDYVLGPPCLLGPTPRMSPGQCTLPDPPTPPSGSAHINLFLCVGGGATTSLPPYNTYLPPNLETVYVKTIYQHCESLNSVYSQQKVMVQEVN